MLSSVSCSVVSQLLRRALQRQLHAHDLDQIQYHQQDHRMRISCLHLEHDSVNGLQAQSVFSLGGLISSSVFAVFEQAGQLVLSYLRNGTQRLVLTNLTPSTWYHFTFVFEANTAFYVNGMRGRGVCLPTRLPSDACASCNQACACRISNKCIVHQ